MYKAIPADQTALSNEAIVVAHSCDMGQIYLSMASPPPAPGCPSWTIYLVRLDLVGDLGKGGFLVGEK